MEGRTKPMLKGGGKMDRNKGKEGKLSEIIKDQKEGRRTEKNQKNDGRK